MSKFFNILNENIPTGQGVSPTKTTQGLTPGIVKPKGKTKKAGFLTKVAAAGKGLKDFSQSIEKIGTGKWDLGSFMQGIIDKELDKGTAKLGMFGKKGYTKIFLGDDITKLINEYEGTDTKKESFLYKVNQLTDLFVEKSKKSLH